MQDNAMIITTNPSIAIISEPKPIMISTASIIVKTIFWHGTYAIGAFYLFVIEFTMEDRS